MPPELTLIATVGMTADPILASIVEHEAQAVVLIASQGSLGTAAKIREEFPSLQHHVLTLNDAESITESFTKARAALKIAKSWESRAIVAEIAGGTKPMTAGLVLALSGFGLTFSYVGGMERNPETGRVIPGRERIRTLEDPTERFHVGEWSAFRAAWNGWRMRSAAEVLENLLRNDTGLSPSEKRFYKHLLLVTNGLDAWDRFHHKKALELLERGMPVALAVAEAWHHGAKMRVLGYLEERLPFLRGLVDKGNKPTEKLLADLLANARRRANAGRYDDALARLYRAVALTAEADLYHQTGIVLHDPTTWPKELPKGYKQQLEEALGLKNILDLVFDIQLALGHKETRAQKLRGLWGQLEPLLKRRHESILAHGTRPVEQEDYEAFMAIFEELGVEEAPPWPRW